MARSKTSKAWLREHVNDPFVQRAKREGFRSRASYKLMEIDNKERFLKPGEIVVDLGATPGGWSQVAAQRLQGRGRVIALDLLAMEPLTQVEFLQGDFHDAATLEKLENLLAGSKVGVVLSDMAPNISGIPVADQARIMLLAELSMDFAVAHLKPGGVFLVKVFQGYGFDEFVKSMRLNFTGVASRKPQASRGRSPELYLIGRMK